MYFIMRCCLLFSLFTLQGCGFQLRGFHTVEGKTYPALPSKGVIVLGGGGVAEKLNQQIATLSPRSNNPLGDKPDTEIILSGEKVEQKILTVNASNQIREYRVYLEQAYRIKYQDKTILENGFLRIFRDYSYKDGSILGKESEQGMLIQDMYQDAANQILQRTIILVSNLQNEGTKDLQDPSSKPSVDQ